MNKATHKKNLKPIVLKDLFPGIKTDLEMFFLAKEWVKLEEEHVCDLGTDPENTFVYCHP